MGTLILRFIVKHFAEKIIAMGVDYLASKFVKGKGISNDLAKAMIKGIAQSKYNNYVLKGDSLVKETKKGEQ